MRLLILTATLLGTGFASAQTLIDAPPVVPADWAAKQPVDPEWKISIAPPGEQAPPFDLKVHFSLGTPAGVCSNYLNYAAVVQDIVYASASAAHFDNCAFAEGLDYISRLTDAAERELDPAFKGWVKGQTPSADAVQRVHAGMFRLGQALHAVQDFYAHSNYLELQINGKTAVTAADVQHLNFFRAAADARVLDLAKSGGLVSGTWPIGGPKQCRAGSATHQQLAKDSPADGKGSERPSADSRTYHFLASILARRSTEQFLSDAALRWPLITQVCTALVGVDPAGDSRKPTRMKP